MKFLSQEGPQPANLAQPAQVHLLESPAPMWPTALLCSQATSLGAGVGRFRPKLILRRAHLWLLKDSE